MGSGIFRWEGCDLPADLVGGKNAAAKEFNQEVEQLPGPRKTISKEEKEVEVEV